MEKKFNKRVIIYIAAAIIAVVVISVFILMSGEKGETWQEHYDLGQQYLVELSYDKAVLEFTDAIKIDPKNADPYIGLADAYIGLGDTAKAVETLETGLAETGDDRISKRLEELKGDDVPDVSEENNAAEAETETQTEAVTERETAVSETEDNRVEVPDLSGMSEEEAAEACIAVGLTSSVSRSNSSDVEKGFVISQSIPAGTKVNAGISVPFTVSEGEKEAIKVELKAENLDFDYLANFEESGWAFAVKGNRGGYVNVDGEFVEVYDDVQELSEDEYEPDCLYSVNGLIYILDRLYPGPDNEYYISQFKINDEGIYPYCQNGKWGYANINTGEIIIPCVYDYVSYFNCGRCLVRQGDEWTVLDEAGEVAFDSSNLSFETVSFINNVIFASSDDNRFNYKAYDIDGNIVDENVMVCPYARANTRYIGGVLTYVYEKDGSYISCAIGKNGQKLFEVNNCSIQFLSSNFEETNGYGLLYNYGKDTNDVIDNNGTNDIIDSKGNIISEFKVNGYYSFGTNDRIFLSDGDGYYLCNFNGERVCSTAFEKGWDTDADLIPAMLNGKWGLIDNNGETIIDFTYDEMLSNTWVRDIETDRDMMKYFIAKKDGKIYIVGRENNIISQLNGDMAYLVFNIDGCNMAVTVNSDETINIYKIIS